MAARNNFSWASVILSYFLVAGGICIGLIMMVVLKMDSQAMLYGALGVGGAIGGFAAGRASRGTTITEPAIGGVLVILTVVGVFVGTGVGTFVWHIAKAEVSKIVLLAGVTSAAGAIGGAYVSEKVLDGHSTSPLVWLVHVSLAVLGACFVALVAVMALLARGETSDGATGGAYFGAIAVGALLSGLAAGASAPRRLLLVSLLATVVGTMGFYLLMTALPGTKDGDGNAALGFGVIGLACGLITMLGAYIGWKTVGAKHAAALANAAVFE